MTPGRLGRSLRVLVVEDNVDSGEMLSALLTVFGHVPRVERNAASGLNALVEFAPDVAILDIGLPDVDGYQLASQIRLAPGFRRLPLIAVSGWGAEEDVRRGREVGFDHHLTKPVSPDVLERLLAEVAGRPGEEDPAGT